MTVRLATEHTLEGLNRLVRQLMSFQRPALNKSLPALITDVILLARVSFYVLLEASVRAETLTTVTTEERSQPAVLQ